MPKFRTLDDIAVRGKRVLLRADLNVPIKNGVVTDTTRIERLAPTIDALLGRGAKVIVISHFGRPKGKRDPALSLRPLIAPLSRAIGDRDVIFAEDCVGDEAKRVISALRPGQVALLENLRFHKEEEANSPDFAGALAELGEVYVYDARFASGTWPTVRARPSSWRIDGIVMLSCQKMWLSPPPSIRRLPAER